MSYKVYFLSILAAASFILTNCGGSDDSGSRSIVRSFDVVLNTANEIPYVTNRNESGTIRMSLFDNNTLDFTIIVNNLSSTDELNVAMFTI